MATRPARFSRSASEVGILWGGSPFNTTLKTPLMTYEVDGEQFVPLAAGSIIMTFALRR